MSNITIKNRWTGEVIISGEYNSHLEAIAACEREGKSLRGSDLRDANLRGSDLRGSDLRDANLSDANLRGSDLRGSNLRGANLRGSDLRGANLRDADLRDADLRDANLRAIRDDFWAVLSSAPREVPGLIAALKKGRVNGSTYQGECSCLVGTLANVRGCSYNQIPSLKPNAYRPAEKWFLGIRQGHTPENNTFSKLAVEWAEEWLGRMQDAFGPSPETEQAAPTA